MKRLAILSTVLTCSIFADSSELLPLAPITKTEGPHHCEVGLDVFWQHSCSSNRASSSKHKFDGCFVGPRVVYEYFQPNSVYFSMEGMAANGASKCAITAYDWRLDPFLGYYCNGSRTFKYRHWTSFYGNIESRLGYASQRGSLTAISYGGLGWNYRKADVTRDWSFSWFYAIGGTRLNQKITQYLDLGLDANVTYAFYTQHHHDKRVARAKADFWGYGISLPMTWHANQKETLDIRLEPYFQSLDANEHFFNLGSRLEMIFRF